MIPAQAALSMIHNAKHSPIEQAYSKVLQDRAREIRNGTIQTFMVIFRCRAIEAERDEIYLFDHYRFV